MAQYPGFVNGPLGPNIDHLHFLSPCLLGRQFRTPSASFWSPIPSVCLTYFGNRMHNLCFHCPSLPTLAPSLCTQLHTPLISNSFLFLEISVVSLPSWPLPMLLPRQEFFSHLFVMDMHCSTPFLGPLVLSFRYHLKCLFIQEAFFTILLHWKPRGDILPMGYFMHLLFLLDLEITMSILIAVFPSRLSAPGTEGLVCLPTVV